MTDRQPIKSWSKLSDRDREKIADDLAESGAFLVKVERFSYRGGFTNEPHGVDFIEARKNPYFGSPDMSAC